MKKSLTISTKENKEKAPENLLALEQDIIRQLLKKNPCSQKELEQFKREMAQKYKIGILSNPQLLQIYHKMVREKKGIKVKNVFWENLLLKKPIRSLSGIVNVSVLTKSYPCVGKCLYCPLEKGLPKSYVSGEPAVQRAKTLHFHPYFQVQKRLEMLQKEGHYTDKVEIRIVGGTWSYYPQSYQLWFVKECFRACNEFAKHQKSKTQASKSKKFAQAINSKLQIKQLKEDLKKAQKRNEKAQNRVVGLSIETRPDFINAQEIQSLRLLGVTMVELGVQSIYDDVLDINLRGHKVWHTIQATQLLKDAGFKVLYQIMPNLPGSDIKRDKEMFKELFANAHFQPDLLKVYPCFLLKKTGLYKLWQKGNYKPYTTEQLLELLTYLKQNIPYYVRIQRIVRDIPANLIINKVANISNLRQILQEKMQKEGKVCRCIRCREIKNNYTPKEKIYLFRQNYQASASTEVFLSLENKERTKLYSMLRLRLPKSEQNQNNIIFPVLKQAALVREIHTYGKVAPLQQSKNTVQHQGLGKKLIQEAEKIAQKEWGLNKIAVIAAVGAREYFRKLGYGLQDTYMVKKLGRNRTGRNRTGRNRTGRNRVPS